MIPAKNPCLAIYSRVVNAETSLADVLATPEANVALIILAPDNEIRGASSLKLLRPL
jgi:hypothetical protein